MPKISLPTWSADGTQLSGFEQLTMNDIVAALRGPFAPPSTPARRSIYMGWVEQTLISTYGLHRCLDHFVGGDFPAAFQKVHDEWTAWLTGREKAGLPVDDAAIAELAAAEKVQAGA